MINIQLKNGILITYLPEKIPFYINPQKISYKSLKSFIWELLIILNFEQQILFHHFNLQFQRTLYFK
jgi:hypothetical protein